MLVVKPNLTAQYLRRIPAYKVQKPVISAVQNPINTTIPKKTAKKRNAIIAAISTTVATVTAMTIAKYKMIKNRKELADIPSDLKYIFAKTQHLSGDEFINKAYEELVEYMDLEDIAPKSIIIKGKDGAKGVVGDYNMINNTITFSEGFRTHLSKYEQFGAMAHELFHCKQAAKMLRAPKVGLEKYAEAIVDRELKKELNNPFDGIGRAYNSAKKTRTERKFLAQLKKQRMKETSEKIRENFKKVLEMPKYIADSAEEREALELLSASSIYEGLNAFGVGADAYYGNKLEKGAYEYSNNITEMGGKLERVINS